MTRLLSLAAALFLASSAYADDATPATNTTSPAPAATATAAVPTPDKPVAKPFVYTPKASDITIGKKNAPVTVVEYASLTCPHCAHYYEEVMPHITGKYINTGKIFFVYRDYPLNRPALKAAEMVHCADSDDHKHAFLRVLFATQQKWAYDAKYEDSLAGIAALGGMDRATFDKCLNDKAGEDTVLGVAKEAQDDWGVKSTPTFFINNTLVEGDAGFESLSNMIDKALAAKK